MTELLQGKCCVCGGDLAKHDKISGLLKCSSCGFVCADTSITNEELKLLYTKKYFNGEEYTNYLVDKDLHIKNFKRRIKRLDKISGGIKGKSVFEIGCAYGFFLAVASEYSEDVSGIDISNDAVEYSKSCSWNAECGDYIDSPAKKNSKDFICMWDTIEHLSNPKGYLEKISEELKSGGFLAITTGDIDSLNARLRGRKWRQIHPPTHLHYFSKKTLIDFL